MFCLSHLWLNMIVSGCDVQENNMGRVAGTRLGRDNHFIAAPVCRACEIDFPISFLFERGLYFKNSF